MTTTESLSGPHPYPRQETDEERRARIAHEADLIEQARVRLDAGEGISGDELAAWLDAYEQTDETVSVPRKLGNIAVTR